MQHAYNFSGGSNVVKKYKVAASHAVGIILIRTAADAGGLSTSTTTSTANAVGLTLDQGMAAAAGGTVAYSTTQGNQEAIYGVIINPDAVLRAQMVNGATGTTATVRTVTSASTPGTTITTGDDWSSPTQDEGTVWCVSGANVGQSRKITSVGTTASTVTVPFLYTIAVGDTFLYHPLFPGEVAITLDTPLTHARHDLTKTGAALTLVDNDLSGTGDSFMHLLSQDHAFSGAIT